MKWVKRILSWLLVLVVLIVGISFLLPNILVVELSTTIYAESETVYGIVNNLKSYVKWMTWNQVDPN